MTDFNKEFNDAIADVLWYPVVNDLYGGWCVSTVKEPLSSLEGHRKDFYIVAECTTFETAMYISDLHNERIFGS